MKIRMPSSIKDKLLVRLNSDKASKAFSKVVSKSTKQSKLEKPKNAKSDSAAKESESSGRKSIFTRGIRKLSFNIRGAGVKRNTNASKIYQILSEGASTMDAKMTKTIDYDSNKAIFKFTFDPDKMRDKYLKCKIADKKELNSTGMNGQFSRELLGMKVSLKDETVGLNINNDCMKGHKIDSPVSPYASKCVTPLRTALDKTIWNMESKLKHAEDGGKIPEKIVAELKTGLEQAKKIREDLKKHAPVLDGVFYKKNLEDVQKAFAEVDKLIDSAEALSHKFSGVTVSDKGHFGEIRKEAKDFLSSYKTRLERAKYDLVHVKTDLAYLGAETTSVRGAAYLKDKCDNIMKDLDDQYREIDSLLNSNDEDAAAKANAELKKVYSNLNDIKEKVFNSLVEAKQDDENYAGVPAKLFEHGLSNMLDQDEQSLSVVSSIAHQGFFSSVSNSVNGKMLQMGFESKIEYHNPLIPSSDSTTFAITKDAEKGTIEIDGCCQGNFKDNDTNPVDGVTFMYDVKASINIDEIPKAAYTAGDAQNELYLGKSAYTQKETTFTVEFDLDKI